MLKTKPKSDGIPPQKPAKLESGIKVKKEISSLHKKKILVGVACVLVAVLLLIYLIPQITNSISSVYEIVTLKSDIKKGSEIKAEHIIITKTKDESVAQAFISNTQDVVGKYAAFDLGKGDYVTTSKLWDENKSDTYTRLDDGYMTMSVSFDTFASSMSGGIRKGDIVSIFGILNASKADPNTTGEEYTPISVLRNELKYVEVVDVSNEQTGKPIDKTTKETAATDDIDAIALSTVTILVNEQQAKLLVDFEHTGYLHFALCYRGDKEDSKVFLEQQQKYLEDILLVETQNDENTKPKEEIE